MAKRAPSPLSPLLDGRFTASQMVSLLEPWFPRLDDVRRLLVARQLGVVRTHKLFHIAGRSGLWGREKYPWRFTRRFVHWLRTDPDPATIEAQLRLGAMSAWFCGLEEPDDDVST